MQTRALLQHERGVTKAAQVGLDRRDAIHPTAVVLVVPWRIWLESAAARWGQSSTTEPMIVTYLPRQIRFKGLPL
jgi:hypothetical protein